MTDHSTGMNYNFRLALVMVWKSLCYHRLVSLSTILGVASGMCVVATILIVDHNTVRSAVRLEQLAEPIKIPAGKGTTVAKNSGESNVISLPIRRITVVKQGDDSMEAGAQFSTQALRKSVSREQRSIARGEEDYQTMRLAIRMASMFAFFIGTVIVFYTMRFSVATRMKEFALLLCLGEHQKNVSLSLVLESLLLGMAGTLAGALAAYPTARLLLSLGISTTGRDPSTLFSMPWLEFVGIAVISLLIAVLGVISPMRTIHRLQLPQVLQPRFVEVDLDQEAFEYRGFSWLIPPLLLATYLALRPFLQDWLSVVYFFMLETVFVLGLVLATLWFTRPFLRLCIRLIELVFMRLLPLETLLTVRRARLNSQKFLFSITGVILVFSLLGGLHAVTRTLKQEIYQWSSEAMTPYYFYHTNSFSELDTVKIEDIEEEHGLHIFRLSATVKGSFPMRLIHAEDVNRYREEVGQAVFTAGQVIMSRTLARRFTAEVGDIIRIQSDTEQHDFDIVEVSDALGAMAEDAQYVDIKSFALFTGDNTLFRGNLGRTMGDYAVARSADQDRQYLRPSHRHSLDPHYRFEKSGLHLAYWQILEINSDFLIFDFILLMTILLAFVGILNTLLIQVHGRRRELSILTAIGVDRNQMVRMLLVEGLVIGIVGGILAMVLSTVLGVISASFLDRFTLFDYQYVWSTMATVLIGCFAVLTCCLSALYPAILATRISATESLHYE
jgi:putative ABC transport system permease protein